MEKKKQKKKPVTLERISVQNLFGRFQHQIDLNQEEGITIISAPNGYGKTVILNLIKYFFSLSFTSFQNYQYDKFSLFFSDTSRIDVKNKKDRKSNENLFFRESEVEFQLYIGKKKSSSWVLDINDLIDNMPRIDRYIPWIERVSRDEWIDERSGKIYSSLEALESFSSDIPSSVQIDLNIPDWLRKICSSVECHLVETQRLLFFESDEASSYRYSRRAIQSRPVVERNALNLRQIISRYVSEYAQQSQKLDESFPKRILDEIDKDAPSEDKIRKSLSDLEGRRNQLVDSGILDKTFSQEISESQIISDNTIKNILNVYLEDTKKKLGVFDEIYEQISIFLDIVNEHFNFKRISISADAGMKVVDDFDNEVPLSALSSGEQHEMIMLYDLIFRVSDNSLILIDEPELSLHVAWQLRFIEDLGKIQQLKPLKIVLATHSPQIVADRWDLAVDLASG